MRKIPVVISSDNNIFFTVGVVLTSLLENAAPETFYEINVLYTSDVTEENKNKLLKLKDKYKNMMLNMFDMGDKFKDIPVTRGYHVNYVSAYKMLIPSMFLQYEKMLYLDTDILIRGDLSDFYDFKIEDNYIAGTPVYSNCILRPRYIMDLLQIPSADYYINAGVMLMNLKKIREDKIDEKWISLLGSYEGSVDQHILNKVCYGKTTNIPQRFNVCLSELEFFKSNQINIFYSPRESLEAYNNPVIFHWTGKEKPWLFYDTWYAQEWLMYFNKSPFAYDIERKRCFICTPSDITKEKFYLFGIPIFKKSYTKFFEYGFLFGFLKIYKKKIWRGNKL